MIHSNTTAAPQTHFDGNWTPEEERLLDQALTLHFGTAEPWIPEHEQELFLEEPWICVKREGTNGRYYFFASRFRMRRVFRATSIDELVSAIEQGAAEQRDPLCREAYVHSKAA